MEKRKVEANEKMRCVRIELRQVRKELMAIKRSVEIIESRMMEGRREERRGENAEDVYGRAKRREEEDTIEESVVYGQRAVDGTRQGEAKMREG